MRKLLALLLTLPLLSAGSTVRAAGLIYKLPEDGAWVKYDMTAMNTRPIQAEAITGSITVSSVGQVTEKGEKCRWIEIRFEMQDGRGVFKMLIPEKQLGKAGRPLESMIRGHVKTDDGDAKVLNNKNRSPMPAFLAGPLSNAGELDEVELDTKLGKLRCKGVTGHHTFQDRTRTCRVQHKTRLHPKAPFGVISSWLEMEVKRDDGDEFIPYAVFELTLAETGKDAKSLLPDVK